MGARRRSIPAISTTSCSWTNEPTGSCPMGGACCHQHRSATAATPASPATSSSPTPVTLPNCAANSPTPSDSSNSASRRSRPNTAPEWTRTTSGYKDGPPKPPPCVKSSWPSKTSELHHRRYEARAPTTSCPSAPTTPKKRTNERAPGPRCQGPARRRDELRHQGPTADGHSRRSHHLRRGCPTSRNLHRLPLQHPDPAIQDHRTTKHTARSNLDLAEDQRCIEHKRDPRPTDSDEGRTSPLP